MRDKRQKVPNTINTNPASMAEKNYAKKMGISLPEDATESDAKAIIARALDDDEKASEGLLTKTSHTQIQTYCLKNLCFSKTNIISYSSSRFFQRINHIFW